MSISIANYLPYEIAQLYENALGPNWEMFMDFELKSRDNSYVPLKKVKPEDLTIFAEINSKQYEDALCDIIRGRGIHNERTLEALCNYNSGIRVKNLLSRDPTQEIKTKDVGGGARVVAVGSYHIPDEPREVILNRRNHSIARHMSSPGADLCRKCIDEAFKNGTFDCRPPALRRETAQYMLYNECITLTCNTCREDYIVDIMF
jgi:hypothetical protein